MKQHVQLYELPTSVLKDLTKGKTVGVLEPVANDLLFHGGGYCTDKVVYRKGKQYYQFLAISYLDDEYTFTTPYEVFRREVHQNPRVTYTSWVEDDDDA